MADLNSETPNSPLNNFCVFLLMPALLLLAFGFLIYMMLGSSEDRYPQLSKVVKQHTALNKLGVDSIQKVFNSKYQGYSFKLCADDECLGPYQINKDGYFYFDAHRYDSGRWVVTANKELKVSHTPEQAHAALTNMLDALTKLYAQDMVKRSTWDSSASSP